MQAMDLFGQWSHVRKGLVQALGQLTDDQLGFSPGEGLWTVGEVATHIASSEDSWLDCAMTHGKVETWPAGRFNAEDYDTVGELEALLAECHARCETFMARLDADGLDRKVGLPWGPFVSVGWILWHILEHEIHHRGEVYLMLGMQGMEAPDV